MWTPKRLLLLVFGFVFFFVAYQVYILFLGKYDGLPPLPDDYAAADNGELLTEPPPRLSSAEMALQKAFGANCPELARPIKLFWRDKGVVLAADRHMLLNGQLRLQKVGMAVFGKQKPDDINTIRGDQADIEFDKPITNLRDAMNPERKPVAGRLDGHVVLKNNRRTPLDPNDDIELHTPWLQYRDDQHRIWTEAEVHIIDGDPWQRKVDANGMEVFLIPSEDRSERSTAKKTKSSISGVKSIQLQNNIHMIMQLDVKTNFLGGPAKDEPTSATGNDKNKGAEVPAASASHLPVPTPRPKALLFINAQGPFLYEPGTDKDRAEFNNQVNVIRKLDAVPGEKPGAAEPEHYDQLDCDKLVLLFDHKKPSPASPPAAREAQASKSRSTDDPGQDLELTHAHATGKQVELVSDAQRLHATCNDLQYEKDDKKGSRTILLGDPELVADKSFENGDNARLRMRGTLTLLHPPADSKDKDIQESHAEGPGEIRMRGADKQPERIARWRDSLHSVKEGASDRYTLLGQASVEDAERGHMQGDQLIFWVEPIELASAAPPGSPASPAPTGIQAAKGAKPEDSRRLRRFDAVGHVALDSKDLQIPKADRLHIEFEDTQRAEGASSSAAPKAPQSGGSPATITGLSPFDDHPPGPTGSPPTAGAAATSPGMAHTQQGVLPQEGGNKQPIVLTAQSVDGKVVRDGSRNDLKEVHAEGKVHVVQEGSTPGDKGVEIKGDSLDLTGTPNGHIMKVVAPQAYVQLDKIVMIGPEVNIDQPQNEAWVNGLGSMKLPSKTDLQGNPLEQPMDVLIYWNEGMYFNGRLAEYRGGVQAVQGPDSRLRAQMLQVFLDRFVSLKERQPGGGEPQAGLDHMLCDKDVELENGVREGVGPHVRWKEFQRVAGVEMDFINRDSELKVAGPGKVWLLKLGSKQDSPLGMAPTGPSRLEAGKAAPAPASQSGSTLPQPPKRDKKPGQENSEEETKLTFVTFQDRMHGCKTTGIVTFFGRVELIDLPADDPDISINPDKLPPNALRVDCDVLKVLKFKKSDQQEEQIFEAKDHVRVKGRNYDGQCDILTYEQSKDLLILKGIGGNVARLSRQTRPNGPFEPITAREIMFWRKENRVEFIDASNIGGIGK